MEAELRARSVPLRLARERPRRCATSTWSASRCSSSSRSPTSSDARPRAASRCARADRGEDDPLVIAGGPTATHPEPLAPFIDALRDRRRRGEARPRSLLAWSALQASRRAARASASRELAELGGVYVPVALRRRRRSRQPAARTSTSRRDPERAAAGRARVRCPTSTSFRSRRTARWPTPRPCSTASSVEIARGCTEGCRFCQAGMIYRPVREREPEAIVETIARRRDATAATTRPR